MDDMEELLNTAPKNKKGTKILVVEDEESARSAITKILQSAGHDVTAAADGPEALELFKSRGDFAIVLTDLSLPGMTGWDVAAEIKKIDPSMPVAILSGWDIEEDDEMIKKSGVSRVLPKPIKVKEIMAAIRELTSKE